MQCSIWSLPKALVNACRIFMRVIPILLSLIIIVIAIALGGGMASEPLWISGLIAATLSLAAIIYLPGWAAVACILFAILPARSAVFPLGYFELFCGFAVLRTAITTSFTKGHKGIIGAVTFFSIVGFTFPFIIHMGLNHFDQGQGKRLALVALVTISLSYLLLSGHLDRSKFWAIPWAGFIAGVILLSFDIINMVMPSALPITRMIYSAQNWEIMADYINPGLISASDRGIRLSGLGQFGLFLSYLCFAYFAVSKKGQGLRLFASIVFSGIGLLFIGLAGYRGNILRWVVSAAAASFCRQMKWVILGTTSAILAVVGMVAYHHYVDSLPLTMQRTLSFLPGDWDYETQRAASSGLTWRANLRNIFFTDNFQHNWLLGRGQQVDDSVRNTHHSLYQGAGEEDFFALSQMWHSGFVSVLDFCGVLGFICLIVGMSKGLLNCLFLQKRKHHLKAWHVWTIMVFLASLAPFWYSGFFETIFPLYAVLLCLLEIAKSEVQKLSDSSKVGLQMGTHPKHSIHIFHGK
jgi:hypothetical protein